MEIAGAIIVEPDVDVGHQNHQDEKNEVSKYHVAYNTGVGVIASTAKIVGIVLSCRQAVAGVGHSQ